MTSFSLFIFGACIGLVLGVLLAVVVEGVWRYKHRRLCNSLNIPPITTGDTR